MEKKLSQYTDDMQMFLDGTEDSLKEALEILNSFYIMTSLRINVEKTRANWTGSLSNSVRQVYGRRKPSKVTFSNKTCK